MTSPNPQEGGKHTPGEWRAEREVDPNGIETGKLWIVMGGAPCAYGFDRYEDAVLAAAAPALYAALKAILSNSNRADITVKQWRAGLDALLQATGGENGR